jgi:hypothetical protein
MHYDAILWEPPNPVAQVIRRPTQPNKEQAFDRGSNGSGRRNQQNSWRFVPHNEVMEMDAHSSQVARDQDVPVLCRDTQRFWIESAIWDCTCGWAELYRRFSSEQSLPNVGIDISVRLKTDLQASLTAASFLACSKRSIMS